MKAQVLSVRDKQEKIDSENEFESVMHRLPSPATWYKEETLI
jgi:hypothetical protein